MKKSLFFAVFLLFYPLQLFASEEDKYPSVDAVPPPLLQYLTQYFSFQTSEARYVGDVVSILSRLSRDGTALTLVDVEAGELYVTREDTRKRLREILRYDTDFDMKVTEKELRDALEAEIGPERNQLVGYGEQQIKAMLDEQVKRLFKAHDHNADGIIPAKEAAAPPEEKRKAAIYYRDEFPETARKLLTLDPDANGTLTLAELEILARKAFRTADTDSDGIISESELEAARGVQRLTRAHRFECSLPKAAAGEKVVLINVSGGGGIPDVTLGGQNMPTGTVRLEIAEGAAPLYIIATSSQPVIWQVEGYASRVARLVVAGPRPYNISSFDGLPTAESAAPVMQGGATGLAASNVVLLDPDDQRGCVNVTRLVEVALNGEKMRSVKVRKSMGMVSIEEFLGRAPDTVVYHYAPNGLFVDDAKVTLLPPRKIVPAPSGFDPAVWEQGQLLHPGEIVSFRGREKDIVTLARVEQYKILPRWAGLAQLVHQGALRAEMRNKPATRVIVRDGTSLISLSGQADSAIVRNSNAEIIVTEEPQYRITREFDNFPPGLHGAYAVQFILSKGLTSPKGRLSPACVITEDDEIESEIVGENLVCR